MRQTARSTKSERPSHPASAYRKVSYGRRWLVIVNWVLTLLTVPAALLVMAIGFAGAMSTDRCAYQYCAHQGPPVPIFDMLFYGAPVVAVLTIVVSRRTAKRGWGILIPLATYVVFASDVVVGQAQ